MIEPRSARILEWPDPRTDRTRLPTYTRASPMSQRSHFLAPVLVMAALLSGCGAAPRAATETPGLAASATPSSDSPLLAEYTAVICPVFDALVVFDPRLNDLRAVATEGGDMSAEQDEIVSLSDGLLVLLNELESLPDWEPGAALRFQLMDSLHGIRARLLDVDRDPAAADAAALIEGMPFIATEALDRAMGAASRGGLACESAL